MCTLSTYHRHNVCAVARIGKASGRCGIDRRTMTVYGVGAGVSEGRRRGRQRETQYIDPCILCRYLKGLCTRYLPWQDLGRGDRCGLRLKARVRKVNNQTARRKKTTLQCT